MIWNKSNRKFWLNMLLVTASVMVTLLFLMYAFVWKAEAEAQGVRLKKMMTEVEEAKINCDEQHELLKDSVSMLRAKIDSLKKHESKRK